MSSALRAAATLLAALPGVATAQACGEILGPGARQAESARYVVAYRTQPTPIVVSQHFGLDLVVCPKAGATAPASVRVDAHMPAHRHGMNYRAQVTPRGPGRYEATGLLFHMPGRWEFLFDVVFAQGVERVAAPVDLP
jgi:hypothetical protein